MSEVNFDPVSLTQSLVQCASVTPKDEGALTIVESHLKESDMETIVDLIDRVISNPEDEESIEAIAKEVNQLMEGRPLFAN